MAHSSADLSSPRWKQSALRHGLPLVGFFVLSLLYFAPVHFGGQGLHGNDIVQWRGMAEAMIEYEEQTGEPALWAPNVFSGMPGYHIRYAPAAPQLDTIIDAARPYLWPTTHFFLLLAGLYALVFYLVRDRWAALLAALAFGFTSYLFIILGAGHQTKFVAIAYAPYLLMAFAYGMRRPGLLSSLLFAVALSLHLRADHPQITYYVLMLALIWWIVETVRAGRSAAWTPHLKATGWLALGTAIGLLMVIHPYWATFEYKDYSIRGAAPGGEAGEGALDWDYAMRWSQGPSEFLTLLIADALGGGGQTYWGPKPFTEGPHYVGGIVVALAGLALWKVRTRLVLTLGLGALFTGLFAMGHHAAWLNRPMFEYFPYFSAFRTPETWMTVTVLCVVLLAAFGLRALLKRPASPRGKRKKRRHAPDGLSTRDSLIPFGAVAGLTLLLWVGGDAFLSFENPDERTRLEQAIQQQRPDLSLNDPQVQQFIRSQLADQRDERQELFQADTQRTLLFVLLAAGLVWAYRTERVEARWAVAVGLAALVLVDLWGVGKRHLSSDDFSPTRSVEQQISTHDFDRFLIERREEAGGAGHFRVYPMALNPMNNAEPSFHHESIGGYHGAKLRRYQDYIDFILQPGQRQGPNKGALDLMGGRYIIGQRALPGTESIYRSERTGLQVFENPDALPRAFFVDRVEVESDVEAMWSRLRDASTNLRAQAFKHQPLEADLDPVDADDPPSVTLGTFTPPEIEWTVETSGQHLLVVNEVYYPAGWNAYLNGEPVPIHRVNYLQRGVVIPEGEHTLAMRFEPRSDRVGGVIAQVATAGVYLGVVVLLALPWWRRRKNGAPDSESDDKASSGEGSGRGSASETSASGDA
ncbi:MAG: hypothetical protein PPP56_08075 [Longimonas sp.]|uniref:hypothetical protein n=1 Tax=Longimonas sp. TaxID=2039626 RepID=UPI00335ED796